MTTLQSPSFTILSDQYIAVQGHNIRYRVAGTGPALILLHGIGRSLEDWSENITALAEQHRVYAIDLLGFGLSDKPDQAYSIDRLRDIVRGFMDALGIEQATIIGNSLGGAIATRLALHASWRVAGMVLLAPAGFGLGIVSFLRLCAVPGLGEWITRKRPDSSGTRQLLSACFHDKRFVTEQRVALTHQLALQPGAQSAFLKTLRSTCTIRGVKKTVLQGIAGQIDKLNIPTLVIWGQQDLILPATYAAIAGQIAGAEVVVFDSCGHFPQIERAAEVNTLIGNFTAKHRI
jgi:pimeloyl-ACP methyl ester carboxylesterase